MELLMENIEKTKKLWNRELFHYAKRGYFRELHAKITSMFHESSILVSEYRGTQKNNYIRILRWQEGITTLK